MRLTTKSAFACALCLVLSAKGACREAASQPSVSPAIAPSNEDRGEIPALNFTDLDNKLRDCDIPFEQLQSRSPFCRGQKIKDGTRCEGFSYSQFPEIVKIKITFPNNSYAICSGTLIAPDWAISAAHCFVDEVATSAYSGSDTEDFVWISGHTASVFSSVLLDAKNAKMISEFSKRRKMATRVVVHKKYAGKSSAVQFDDDLALIHLETPYSAEAVQPAELAMPDAFSTLTTIAGYGYSNANGGEFGLFNLTWPVAVVRRGGQFSFRNKKGQSIKSNFCQGDSGGPVFAGRYRGCKPDDIVPERRPHLLQGTISFNHKGEPEGSTAEKRASSSCRNSELPMVMQDLTTAERHKWICGVVENAAAGCK